MSGLGSCKSCFYMYGSSFVCRAQHISQKCWTFHWNALKNEHILFVFFHTKNTLTIRPSDKTQKGVQKDYCPGSVCLKTQPSIRIQRDMVWETEWLTIFRVYHKNSTTHPTKWNMEPVRTGCNAMVWFCLVCHGSPSLTIYFQCSDLLTRIVK